MDEFGLSSLSPAERIRLFCEERKSIRDGLALGDKNEQPIIPDGTESRTSDISRSGRSEGIVALHSSPAEPVVTHVDEFTSDEGMGGVYSHDFGINEFDIYGSIEYSLKGTEEDTRHPTEIDPFDPRREFLDTQAGISLAVTDLIPEDIDITEGYRNGKPR
jgi:hypothetical protein